MITSSLDWSSRNQDVIQPLVSLFPPFPHQYIWDREEWAGLEMITWMEGEK